MSLSAIAGVVLVYLGVRDVDPNGVRTRSGQHMILLGMVVVVGAIMVGLPELIPGFKDGRAD